MDLVENYSLPIGFFGKLPKIADFIKMNATGNEISVVDQWLQEGLATARVKFKNDWKRFYKNTYTTNFIFPFTGTDKIIIGTLFPSNDRSGRIFPFILFGNFKKEMINKLPLHFALLEFNELFKYFESIFQANYHKDNLNELKSLLNNYSKISFNHISMENTYKEYLANNAIGEIFNLEKEDSIPLENNSFNNLINKKISYLENAPGIRFSFYVGDNDELLKLCFVTELLTKHYLKNEQTPALFWSKSEENNIILLIYFQKPTPGNFLDLMYSEDQIYKNLTRGTENIFKESVDIHVGTSLKEILAAIKNNIN
jgi:type VI secretion system ImpM family protein